MKELKQNNQEPSSVPVQVRRLSKSVSQYHNEPYGRSFETPGRGIYGGILSNGEGRSFYGNHKAERVSYVTAEEENINICNNKKYFSTNFIHLEKKSARWALPILKLAVMVHFNAAEHLNNYKGGKVSKNGKHSMKTKLKESV